MQLKIGNNRSLSFEKLNLLTNHLSSLHSHKTLIIMMMQVNAFIKH